MRLQLDFTGTHESEQRDFSLPPVGEYPCIMLVEGYKKDAGGELMTGLDGQPVLLTTGKGNPMWNLRNTIVDGPHLGKTFRTRMSAAPLKHIPFDAAHMGRGTFTDPGPNAEEVADMLARRERGE